MDGDRAAAMIAGAQADALIILSNVPGLLAEYPDEDSVIHHVPRGHLGMVESLAQGRMKKKLLAAREALERNVRRDPGRFPPACARARPR